MKSVSGWIEINNQVLAIKPVQLSLPSPNLYTSQIFVHSVRTFAAWLII